MVQIFLEQKMLRLSKLTDYGTVILCHIAKEPGKLHASQEISTATGITLPTVSKILKLLVKGGVLNSVRGARGGYQLARNAAQVSVASVIHALEGPIALTECSLTRHDCQQAAGCEQRANWGLINQTIRMALEAISLADMIIPGKASDEETLIPVADLLR